MQISDRAFEALVEAEMAHRRSPKDDLDALDREMVLWRRAVVVIAGGLIGAGVALYVWAVATA